MGQIIAFEGPSGSGKGYQVEQAKAIYQDNCFPIKRPTYPRTLDDWLGVWSSSMLDYQAILAACVQEKFVLADRFLLSRWVYASITKNNGKLFDNWYENLNLSWETLTSMAYLESKLRYTETKPLSVSLYVLLPEPKIIDQQRLLTGKDYPFNAKQEYNLYSQIALFLKIKPIPGLNIIISKQTNRNFTYND